MAPRKELYTTGSCCLIRENLKFLRKRLLFWEESGQEQEGALQRLKHSGDNQAPWNRLPTKPDGLTGAEKPLAVASPHYNSREAFDYKLYTDLMIFRSLAK